MSTLTFIGIAAVFVGTLLVIAHVGGFWGEARDLYNYAKEVVKDPFK